MPAFQERPRRSAVIIGASAILLVMVAAVSFARSDQSLRVADDAAVIRDSETARAAAATYRANLTIAVVAAAAESVESAERALEAADAALTQMATAAESLSEPTVTQGIGHLQESHLEVAERLSGGKVTVADRQVSTETLPILDGVQRELASISGGAASRIDAELASAGRTARMSSFVVALIVPALALWSYRRSVQRRLERERLADELARQRDLAEVQQSLISGMSHQLRTPLTGIYGFAEALVADAGTGTPDPGFVQEAGSTILGEANRLRGMVDDILVTARQQAGDLAFEHAPFEVSSEVKAAIEPFAATGADVDVDCETATLVGDRQRLRHVLRNLVDNAVRHGAPPVSVNGRHVDDGYELTVTDRGAGLPDGDLSQMFAHTGDEALVTGSLGLGLSVCRSLCDGMGVELSHGRVDGVTEVRLRFGPSQVAASIETEGLTVRR